MATQKKTAKKKATKKKATKKKATKKTPRATPEQQRKVGKVMHEFKEGELRSGGDGSAVTERDQAVAIAMNEAGLAWSDSSSGKKTAKKKASKKKASKKKAAKKKASK